MRTGRVVGIALLSLIVATEAVAHASGRGFVLLLPVETMQWSGTVAIALSFLLIALVPPGVLRGLFREWLLPGVRMPPMEVAISLLGLAFWAVLVGAGFNGARDPLSNPLPLTLWTLVWVGLALVCAFIGNVWAVLNPWSGLARVLGAKPVLALPEWVGYAPALAGLFAFGWFEIVDLAPDDPARLARAVAVYWLITFAGIMVFGERDWMARGEFLNVFFGFIGRLAPLRMTRMADAPERVQVTLSMPGAGLVSGPVPPLSGALFILCALATVSFDGMSETWAWLGGLGINPLEFPGRSAVVVQNSLGLIGAGALLTGVFVLSVGAGIAVTGRPPRLSPALSRLALSVIPISLAYHFAHYLVALLVNGQYALVAASDPLGTGADWMGLGQFYVTTSFLNVQESVELIWRVQSLAIIIGHAIAVCVAHRVALDLWPTPRRATLGQIPLGALMVGYTFFGLWLLAQPTA